MGRVANSTVNVPEPASSISSDLGSSSSSATAESLSVMVTLTAHTEPQLLASVSIKLA